MKTNRKLVICTIASPTAGLFSREAMRNAMASCLSEIESEDPDIFGTLLSNWCSGRVDRPNLTDAMIDRRVAEILRNGLVFDDIATVEIRGKTPGGLQLQFDIGSKTIVARIMNYLQRDEHPEAYGIIGQLKEIIGKFHPDVEFKDISI